MKASDIQNKIKGLYKDVEPDHFQVSDAKILRYERQGMQQKELWDNYTPAEKDKRLHNVIKANEDYNSNRGTYILRSPGIDLLDFYDAKWHEYVDNLGVNGGMSGKNKGRNRVGKVPPSVVYKMRFELSGPRAGGNASTISPFKHEAWELMGEYLEQDSVWCNYHLDTRKTMYRWLTQERSISYEFNILEELYDFMDAHIGMKVDRGQIRPHSKKNCRPDTIWWRKEAAGWSIVVDNTHIKDVSDK
tara:strand:- start:38 stop:775 length:738 start_codon:yes stop_codon:yes gene_type:complete